MNKKQLIRLLLFGFLSWLIPFAFSFLFYRPGGEIKVSYDLFKSIMIVFATATGCYFLYRYFKSVWAEFIKQGIMVGLAWLAINILFDVVLLLPMMKVSFAVYFYSIGLRYLIIPAIGITIGFLLHNKTGNGKT
jgi:hypothetical protein